VNGPRYEGGETVEGRLAAVVMELLHSIEERNRSENRSDIVDYADIAAALRPYVKKEIVHARMEEVREARTESRNRLIAREATLVQELANLEAQIANRGSEGPR
jgi:FMN-dependent NADH-azoreductase